MLIFEWTLLLLAAAVALAALARRWKLPYPSLLALLGCALVFLPGVPRIELDPQLALALFVAPVLLDAAYDTSTRDLRDNWLSVSSLVLVAVLVTTAAVACVAKALVPALPWAAAVVLGAIVAPPDAAAATAVLRTAPLPHRIRQILEGESLLNDATSLLVYRVALAATLEPGFEVGRALPMLLVVAVGSLVAGAGLAWVATRLLRRIEDVSSSIVVQFASTFGVWIAAEKLGLSGILTMVVYGIGIARVAPTTTPARIRLPSYAVWATLVFVLNALAFVLIGLQLGPILERLSGAQRAEYARVALAALGTVVVARIVWVMLFNLVVRRRPELVAGRGRRRLADPTARGGFVIAWAGMRGIVTLAAALALPASFPGRDLILVVAFAVVLGTLVLQGMTLRPLLLWFDLKDDAPVEHEAGVARAAALRAALDRLDGDESKAAKILRAEYRQLWSPRDGQDAAHVARLEALPALRATSVAAARAAVAALRRDGTIGDDAYHRVEVELDHVEISAEAGAASR